MRQKPEMKKTMQENTDAAFPGAMRLLRAIERRQRWQRRRRLAWLWCLFGLALVLVLWAFVRSGWSLLMALLLLFVRSALFDWVLVLLFVINWGFILVRQETNLFLIAANVLDGLVILWLIATRHNIRLLPEENHDGRKNYSRSRIQT